jgi:biliverdin reductase
LFNTHRKDMLKVGIVGTGFAAKARGKAVQAAQQRAKLVGVCGGDPQRTQAFAEEFGVSAYTDLTTLLDAQDPDVVVIAHRNVHHATAARQALEANKHTVVEYPLALYWVQGKELQQLAQQRNRLLHVEHIELLGGWHQTLRQYLPSLGYPRFVRYATLQSKHPSPDHWTYRLREFGFPFVGGLSRIHRLTDVLGEVSAVQAQAQFLPALSPLETSRNAFQSCICTAQLFFKQGPLATITYGKGQHIWRSERLMEVYGDEGTLVFDGDRGTLFNAGGETPLDVGGRTGLFVKDTEAVLDYLQEGKPLYVSLEASLYALKVATAIERAAATGQTIVIDPAPPGRVFS